MNESLHSEDQKLVGGILDRMSSDLEMIFDRKILIEEPRCERVHERPAGRGQVHISFKLTFKTGDRAEQGCILVPLPEAISMASYLMMVPDETVEENRSWTELDRPMKDALLEVGNFIAGAVDAVVRSHGPDDCSVASAGCQGARAEVRPALVYEEGDELLVGRAITCVHEYPEFELILMLPGGILRAHETSA